MADKESIGDIDVTGWSEADKKALRAACAERTEAEAALATTQTAREAAARSPAAIIAEQQEIARVARRRAEAAAALEKAELAHGKKRALLVPMRDGGFVLRALTLAETDAASLRAEQLQGQERITVHREALLDSIVYPPREEAKVHLASYPGDWGVLYAARDLLISNLETEHVGKAAASS